MVAGFALERRGGTHEIAVSDTAVHTPRTSAFSKEQIDGIKRKLAKPRDVVVEARPEPVLVEH